MRHFLSPHIDEECCPDFTKRVCFACRHDIADKLTFLAHNLAVAGALCKAHNYGAFCAVMLNTYRREEWAPGCGRRQG